MRGSTGPVALSVAGLFRFWRNDTATGQDFFAGRTLEKRIVIAVLNRGLKIAG
jgi:hypothetical protein